MTKTQRLLNALTQGAMTAEELALKTSLSLQAARGVIGDMRKFGYVKSTPTTYCLTDKGEEWRDRIVKTPPNEIARKVQKRREKRLENRSMVENTIRQQPNSVFALGGK